MTTRKLLLAALLLVHAGAMAQEANFVSGDAPWEILKDLKDWGVYVSYGQLAAATGFVGVTFNHRLTGV